MNVHKPTGKKVSSWPQMVARLTEEKEELVRKNEKFNEEVMEAQAKNDS